MKTLNRFIIEKLKLGKNVQINNYNFYPKDFEELRNLIEQLLEERGSDADLNDIDVSKMNIFYDTNRKLGLFEDLDPHNIDISLWNVSNIENMSCMFCSCENFNCNLSKWDVRNVEKMVCMFWGCKKFKGDGLENWKPIKCKNMTSMFSRCENFNCNLSKWDVSNVKNMECMFKNCFKFNYDLSNWNINNVIIKSNMFDHCDSLKNIPSWYKK